MFRTTLNMFATKGKRTFGKTCNKELCVFKKK